MAWSHSELVVEFYDQHLPLGHTVGDIQYYLEALKGVAGKVLEPACGTGRMLIPLLEAGHEAEGLDHSPEMIALCRRYCQERGLDPVLHVADFAAFEAPNAYQAIVMPAGSIRNVDGRKATLGALRRFHDALVSGGLLLIDVIAPRHIPPTGPWRYFRKDPYLLTCQMVHAEHDPVANRTTTYLKYEKWCDGDLLTTELHRFCVQQWGLWEFEQLLVEAGFLVTEITGDYQKGNPPGRETGDWTFHAVRS